MDHYATLGIDKSSNQDDIKKAYRQNALKYHPDTGGDEAKFKECTEAYEILSDPEKKEFYDMYGEDPNPNRGSGMYDPFVHVRNRMRMRRMGTVPLRGSHLRVTVDSTLEESVKDDVTRTISYKRKIRCKTCNNTGLKTGHKRTECTTCKGNGQFVKRQTSGNMVYEERSICPICHGAGQSIADKDKCDDCQGTGCITKEKEITVKIPAFVWQDPNYYHTVHGVLLQGQGNCGVNGGPNGDLQVFINILEHDFFKTKDEHILLYVPITLNQAIFGDSIEVPTINQNVITVEIPKRTKHDDFVKKSKYGRLNPNGEKGDMYIIFNIDIPEDLPALCEVALKNIEAIWPEVDNKNMLDYIERIKNV
jgi:molecular chaperone DnaJ